MLPIFTCDGLTIACGFVGPMAGVWPQSVDLGEENPAGEEVGSDFIEEDGEAVTNTWALGAAAAAWVPFT